MKQLFKYQPEPRDLFNSGFIRLTQLSALNDPFEASYFKAGLEKLVSHFDDSTVIDYELGEISFSKYVQNKMRRVGVVSLSENKENLLMWAHYANEHKGVIAGIAYIEIFGSIFENLFKAEDHFLGTSWGDRFSQFDGIPKPISYRKGLRYRNDIFDYDYSNIAVEGADRILYEILMQKSDEWIYEQEHRVVLRLEQADRVILDVRELKDITNKNIKDKIFSSNYSFIKINSGICIIDLYEIEDKIMRLTFALELSKLSHNPSSIYLMRLKASCINNCLIGLNSNFNKGNIEYEYASSVGYLDFWKAVRNFDYYSLDYIQI